LVLVELDHRAGRRRVPESPSSSSTEMRARDPVVGLRVFKLRTYSAGVFLMTVLGFVLYGSMLLVPIFLQTLLGYPASTPA